MYRMHQMPLEVFEVSSRAQMPLEAFWCVGARLEQLHDVLFWVAFTLCVRLDGTSNSEDTYLTSDR